VSGTRGGAGITGCRSLCSPLPGHGVPTALQPTPHLKPPWAGSCHPPLSLDPGQEDRALHPLRSPPVP